MQKEGAGPRSPVEAHDGSGGASLAERINEWLSLPMAILAVVWVIVTILEIIETSHGERKRFISTLSLSLWIAFALEFLFELAITPDRKKFLRSHWITAISVVAPVFSVLRILPALAAVRAALAARGLFVATSVPQVIGRALAENRFVHLLLMFVLIVLLGSAGIYLTEQGAAESSFHGFGFTTYWSACMATTVNFGPEPELLPGRIIALLLRVCGVGFFGYVAGGLASRLFGVRLTRPEKPEREEKPPPPSADKA
jgi:voltage-gated potassium channel